MGSRPALPDPLDHPAAMGAVALVSGALLALALRGLPGLDTRSPGSPPCPICSPRHTWRRESALGFFCGALIAGQLGGGVLLDHFGVLGTATRPIDAVRVLGVAALLVGVVLVRGVR